MLSKFRQSRHVARDGTAPIRITFTKDRRNVDIPTGISVPPSQWDGSKVVGRPDRNAVNAHLSRKRTETDAALIRIMERPDWPRLSAYEVRDLVLGRDARRAERLFTARMERFASLKSREGTRKLYLLTLSHVRKFDPKADGLSFEDVDYAWLTRFDNSLAEEGMARNSANIHLRNIRAVFNDAIDDGITSAYPFRRFRIRPEGTPKRSLPVEDLRALFAWPVDPDQRRYIDYFKLIFMLVGINAVDLYGLKEVTREGRIEYHRAKTNRLYSIKVEPEAMELIRKYRGKRGLLDIADREASHAIFTKVINRRLKQIGEVTYGRHGVKSVRPAFPKLTTYWARHSWATIAASLDIPKETIAAGLGHGGNTVTDIYIDFDRRKVDEANRRVMDWVLYGKK